MQGSKLVFTVDDSKPEDSVDHMQMEQSYDGLPDSTVPYVPPHWHKNHDEYMHVTQGRVEFTLDGKSVISKPDDPVLFIPRGHVHSISGFKGEASTFVEWTMPAGDFKQLFFEDLLDDGHLSMLTAWRAFYYGDTCLALPGGFKLVDQAVTYGLGWTASWLFPQKNKGMLADSVKNMPVEAKL